MAPIVAVKRKYCPPSADSKDNRAISSESRSKKRKRVTKVTSREPTQNDNDALSTIDLSLTVISAVEGAVETTVTYSTDGVRGTDHNRRIEDQISPSGRYRIPSMCSEVQSEINRETESTTITGNIAFSQVQQAIIPGSVAPIRHGFFGGMDHMRQIDPDLIWRHFRRNSWSEEGERKGEKKGERAGENEHICVVKRKYAPQPVRRSDSNCGDNDHNSDNRDSNIKSNKKSTRKMNKKRTNLPCVNDSIQRECFVHNNIGEVLEACTGSSNSTGKSDGKTEKAEKIAIQGNEREDIRMLSSGTVAGEGQGTGSEGCDAGIGRAGEDVETGTKKKKKKKRRNKSVKRRRLKEMLEIAANAAVTNRSTAAAAADVSAAGSVIAFEYGLNENGDKNSNNNRNMMNRSNILYATSSSNGKSDGNIELNKMGDNRDNGNNNDKAEPRNKSHRNGYISPTGVRIHNFKQLQVCRAYVLKLTICSQA